MAAAFNGSPGMTIDMNECDYLFTSERSATSRGIIHLRCPAGKKIQITIASGRVTVCTIDIAEQTLEGINYHNIGEEAKTTTETTIESAVTGIVAEATGTEANCKIAVNTALKGRLTTGNAIATAETDSETSPVMANGWWK